MSDEKKTVALVACVIAVALALIFGVPVARIIVFGVSAFVMACLGVAGGEEYTAGRVACIVAAVLCAIALLISIVSMVLS